MVRKSERTVGPFNVSFIAICGGRGAFSLETDSIRDASYEVEMNFIKNFFKKLFQLYVNTKYMPFLCWS